MFSFLQEDLTRETLHKQYQLVKSHTNTSHVMQYGNKVSGASGSLACNTYLLMMRTGTHHPEKRPRHGASHGRSIPEILSRLWNRTC